MFTRARPLIPMQNQINPVHTILPSSLTIHFIILPYTPRSSNQSPSFRSLHQHAVCSFLPKVLHALPIASSLIYWLNNIWWKENIRVLLIMHVTPFFYHQLSLCPSKAIMLLPFANNHLLIKGSTFQQ